MELFTLLCDSCASKLKVTRTNAVGQVLACPKCSEMIQVVPPPGWTPSAEVENSLSSEDLAKLRSLAGSSSSFEDIDDVLAKPLPTPNKAKLPIPVPKAKNKNPATSNPSPATDPILPTGQWTTAQSQQRRKLLLIGATVLGSVVIIGSLIVAVIANRKPTPVVANNGNSRIESAVETDETPDEEHSTDELPVESSPPDEPPVESSPPEQPDDEIKTENKPAPSNENSTIENVAPPEINVGQENNGETSLDDPPEIPGMNPNANLPANPLVNNNLEPESVTPSDDLVSRDVFGNPIEDDSSLGSLSELLDQSNTSIRELQDLAESLRDEETLGIAKYYIARPDVDENNVTIERRLGRPCGGIMYNDIPILAMLRDITAITGVPFAFDSANLHAKGFDFAAKTNLKLEDSEDQPADFELAVQTALAPLNIQRVITRSGSVLIRPADALQMSSVNYGLPKFVNDEGLGDQLVEFIKRMIAPTSWVAEANPATIVLEAHGLLVNQTAINHRQLKDLLDKLVFVEQFKGATAEISKQDVMMSRWGAIQNALNKPLDLDRTFEVPLESLCTTIQQKSGVTVLIDWPSVMQEGWTPATMVPGNVNETSVNQAIREIARSMKLTMRIVDATTVELTTFQTATSYSELEVYYYGDILEKKTLTEEQTLDVVRQTLARELNSNPNVRMDYFPQLKCIVCIAPQSLQRQLEIVLDRLREL